MLGCFVVVLQLPGAFCKHVHIKLITSHVDAAAAAASTASAAASTAADDNYAAAAAAAAAAG
jgi:hypothetical protein